MMVCGAYAIGRETGGRAKALILGLELTGSYVTTCEREQGEIRNIPFKEVLFLRFLVINTDIHLAIYSFVSNLR